MYLEDLLCALMIGDNHDIAFLADSNSAAHTVYNFAA